MTAPREILSLSTQLRQLLIERIRSGMYPVGHRLESARLAAAEFGVHSNTVSRVYRELSDAGILRTVHGSGTYVVTVPGPEHDHQIRDALHAAAKNLAEQARRLGISHTDWLSLVSQAEVFTDTDLNHAVWMVECSRKDTEELAAGLSRILDREITPLLVDEVGDQPRSGQDTFITTPFHFDEVAEIVGDTSQVLNVNVVPTSATLVQFAQLPTNALIHVVASNEPTLKRMVRMFETYARNKPARAFLISHPEARTLIQSAEILVDSQSIHDQVMEWLPTGQIITVRYQIEPNSVEYVRESLRQSMKRSQPELGDTPDVATQKQGLQISRS